MQSIMRYRSLSDFVQHLESMGELKRISVPVSTDLEITEIADRVVKGHGPALLFEQTGTEFPLLINGFASDSRMAAALGVENLDAIPADLTNLLNQLGKIREKGLAPKLNALPKVLKMSRWLPRKARGRGACQEVVMPSPDLHKLPVLKCWPHDGGPFITLPLVHTMDPDSGQTNTGMYRMQVYDSITTGMHWHMHKDGAAHYRKYKKLGRRMPVTVTLGGDPAFTYAATAPLPPMVDEYLFAGVIRKKGVKLVKSLTNEIWIPSDADIVIEGYVDINEPFRMEGPFGDHTGFYSLADLYPVFHVTAITHRRGAIYPSTIVGIPPQEDLWLGKATEKIFLMPIKTTIAPEISDMHMPAAGVFHNLVLTSIRAEYPGHARKVASALWGAGQMMFNKIVVMLDEKVNLRNYPDVLKAIFHNTEPERDLFFSTGPLDVLDHSSRSFSYGSKLGVDATGKTSARVRIAATQELFGNIAATPAVKGLSPEYSPTGNPYLIVYVDKKEGITVGGIHSRIAQLHGSDALDYIFYLDNEAAHLDLEAALWLITGNIDPQRDFMQTVTQSGKSLIGFDATRKTRTSDGFERDWPNLTCMDIETINLVDARWKSYDIGALLQSPSLRFLPYQQGDGAVAEDSGQV
jgi:4-hydroxy-3-polyprenylbenzoate decarboxylase